MKSQYQKIPNVVLKVGPQYFHPRDKKKHLSCHNILPINISEFEIQSEFSRIRSILKIRLSTTIFCITRKSEGDSVVLWVQILVSSTNLFSYLIYFDTLQHRN